MVYTLPKLLWLFFIYSVLGWVLETNVTAIKKHKFVNRGVMNGPICIIYGIGAVITTVVFRDLKTNVFFLFLGCAILSSVLEWSAGKFLERFQKKKWWDYSDKKFNLDGYICLEYGIIWGVLGVIVLLFVNPLLLGIYKAIPALIRTIVIIACSVIFGVDIFGTYVGLRSIREDREINREIKKANSRIIIFLKNIKKKFAAKINKRYEKAYPVLQKAEKSNVSVAELEIQKELKKKIFAYGCCFYKVFIIFVIGAFLGDIVETIFCRYTMGKWMSRSSLVWGPFSVVWGFAMAIATVLLYSYRNKSNGFIFWFGTFLGGVYEYICSVFTEIVFGKVFWDYSKMPLNLGGRINLLYCFFWGIAAVVWLKKIYPLLSKYIELIPKKIGNVLVWLLIAFMTANIAVSMAALVRYNERATEAGKVPSNRIERYLDEKYDDARMKKIYPNAKSANKIKNDINSKKEANELKKAGK